MTFLYLCVAGFSPTYNQWWQSISVVNKMCWIWRKTHIQSVNPTRIYSLWRPLTWSAFLTEDELHHLTSFSIFRPASPWPMDSEDGLEGETQTHWFSTETTIHSLLSRHSMIYQKKRESKESKRIGDNRLSSFVRHFSLSLPSTMTGIKEKAPTRCLISLLLAHFRPLSLSNLYTLLINLFCRYENRHCCALHARRGSGRYVSYHNESTEES